MKIYQLFVVNKSANTHINVQDEVSFIESRIGMYNSVINNTIKHLQTITRLQFIVECINYVSLLFSQTLLWSRAVNVHQLKQKNCSNIVEREIEACGFFLQLNEP